MEILRRVQKFEHIKLLADGRRRTILRLLMAGPATLTDLGKILGEHPARVRHHLKKLEKAGFVELVDTQAVHGFVEKYYRARARAFVFHELILPVAPDADGQVLVALGSDDLALNTLAERLSERVEMHVLPVGSLEGLIALRQGTAHMAGCHLLDIESEQYNLPFVQRLFPDRKINLVTLASRTQGLIVAPGNPLNFHDLSDLAQNGVIFINRNRGSGTRLWFDRQLERQGLEASRIKGYHFEARTHSAVAEAVARGRATAGLGLQAAAEQYDLGFIPLFQERYDLALPAEGPNPHGLGLLLDYLQTAEARRQIASLPGYETGETGQEIASP